MTSLTVNGSAVEVDAPPDTPLLSVLRNELGLAGTRFGCGLGQCGACFVRVDDAVVSSCDTLLWSVAGKSVVTVEGLGEHVRQALLDEQAAQCGFCISGVIVSATAFLEANPRPDANEVAAALDRNLCRCGSHRRIINAILKASS